VTTDPGSDRVTAGPTPGGIVARPATPSDLAAVAHIMVTSFPGEFRLLFDNRQDVAVEVMRHLLDDNYAQGDGAWVACDGERVVGMMLLDSPPGIHLGWTWRLAWHIAWQHVGPRGWPRLALGLLMPRYVARAGEVYVRAIAVAADYRGRGAGTLLLRCAEEWGRRHHKGWLGLHVNSENPRAHALYRRMGYRDGRYRSSPLMRIMLRQRGSYYMATELGEGKE